MTAMSRRVVVLEGPDGGGKTTLARAICERTGARYVHHGPYPGVGARALPRFYLDAIAPALVGDADIVVDRSWLSELAYGPVYRGRSRIDALDLRMLDRVLARCRTTVVRCLPPVEACLAAFRARSETEYLPTEGLVRKVYDRYVSALGSWTALPVVTFDYTRGDGATRVDALWSSNATAPWRTATIGSGWCDAPVVVVDETVGNHKSVDPWLRYPFVSFADAGCSRWLARELETAGIPESALRWVNANDPGIESVFGRTPVRVVLALGQVAAQRVVGVYGGVPWVVDHPQYLKRFQRKRGRLDEFRQVLGRLARLLNGGT
jgi:hypothetical protein